MLGHETMTSSLDTGYCCLTSTNKWIWQWIAPNGNGGKQRLTFCSGSGIYDCAVPLLWTVMPECGASDTAERKELSVVS